MQVDQAEQLKAEYIELLQAKEAAIKYNKLSILFPETGPYRRELYPKQIEFMNASATYSQIAFVAANRVGKTLTAATLVAYHATGLYPDWYEGRKFLNATSIWVAGRTTGDVRDVQQFELLGEIEDIGTGTIPKHLIVGKPRSAAGVSGGVSSFRVRHVSGGISIIKFKTYEPGREGFQGTKQQVIWLDEEPKDSVKDIYGECITRLMDQYNPGILIFTFTPLFGRSNIVKSFMPGGKCPKNGVNPFDKDKYVVQATWDDVPHMNEEQKEKLLASYAPHERLARSKGIPVAGASAVYPYLEEEIICAPFEIPVWWKRVYGMDVGLKTAAVWLAIDPDTGNIYAYSEYFKADGSLPVMHTQAIKARGEWIPGVVDPASIAKHPTDGKALFNIYEDLGLRLEFADNALEAGIYEVRELFESGRFKIFSTLEFLLIEIGGYARDEDGSIPKPQDDHLLDAMRYAVRSGIALAKTKQDEYEREDYFSSLGYEVAGSAHKDKITGY